MTHVSGVFLTHRWLGRTVLCAIIGVGVVRIAGTYAVFNQVYDEPYHLLRGMLWITGRPYRYVEHPPLAQMCFAVGPYLGGVAVDDTGNKVRDGNELLYAGGNYFRTLTLARLGNLLFFVWAAAAVHRWATTEHGPGTGLLAVVLFTNLPPVLGHAAVATTDMAITATLTTFVYALMRCFDEATMHRAALVGVAAGTALLAKFSALLLLPVACLAVVLLYEIAGSASRHTGFKAMLLKGAFAVLIAGHVVWAGYRFSVGRISLSEERETLPRFARETIADQGIAGAVARTLQATPVPAPEFMEGIMWLLSKAERGHALYFLGQARHDEASWLFFPVVLLVKTPLAFLIAFSLGALFVFKSLRNDWRHLVPPTVGAAIVVAVLPSTINLGVRHILPVYPLLSITAAVVLGRVWNSKKLGSSGRGITTGLLLWMLLACARAHPDYLSYFNELAARAPEAIVVDSDLDWGQDLTRLSDELQRRGIKQVALAYFGTADPARHGLPKFTMLRPDRQTAGWVAISLTRLKTRTGYQWLLDHKPVTTIGRSIRLYYIGEDERGRSAAESRSGLDGGNGKRP